MSSVAINQVYDEELEAKKTVEHGVAEGDPSERHNFKMIGNLSL